MEPSEFCAARRTYNKPEAFPEETEMIALVPNVELSFEISKPESAEIDAVMLDIKFVPLIERDCEGEAVPLRVSNPVKLFGATSNSGFTMTGTSMITELYFAKLG